MSSLRIHRPLPFRSLLSLLFGVGIFLFWLLAFPQALGYHEQYQLFLFTSSYLTERLAVAGGVAAWLGECVVQCFALSWAGAGLLAVLFVALQQCCRTVRRGESESWTAFLLSFLVPLLVLLYLGDSEALPTYLVALTLVLASRRLPAHLLLVLFPLLWWAWGPVAWVTVPETLSRLPREGRARRVVGGLLWCMAAQTVLTLLFLRQYPLKEVWTGIGYHRIPMHLPALQWITALVAAGLPFVQRTGLRGVVGGLPVLLLPVGCVACIPLAYDADTWRQIRCDQLVRRERWDDLLALYEGKHPADNYTCVCLNLALAMRGELAERMYYTGEGGTEALARPFENNCFSLLPSAEVFFRCGMVSEALRYYYNSQEAIVNGARSSRCMVRMVECYLIDGDYEVACKHIAQLKHTLFYRGWAKEMERLCESDEAVGSHPVYGRLRQLRSERDFLFNYDELYKMFGLLYLHDRSNHLALAYYVANCRLLGLQP